MNFNRYYFITIFLISINFNALAASSDHFVSTWNTEIPGQSNSSSVTIRTNSGLSYSYNVDWDNDGVFDELALTTSVTHDFTIPGIKTIRISGNFPAIFSRYNEDISKLISIDQWGTNPWESMNSAFYNAKNLVNNASDTPNLSQCTDMSYMFSNASLVGKPSESANWNWDVSNISSMQGSFSSAASFNQNISSWVTSNVENMSNMFINAVAFDQDLSLWDIQNVTSFTNIFKGINLTIENYDNILVNWNTQSIQSNLNFNAGSSIYCSQAAQSAHDNLTANLNWTIEDGGICEPQLTIISNNTKRIDEGKLTVMQVVTSDPDFDTVTYSISGGEDQASFSINPSSGLLTFNSSPDFENPMDIDSNNIYILEVTATDDGNPIETASQTITVFIDNIYEDSPSDDFVTTWKTDNQGVTSNTSITLPIYTFNNSNASYNVDWDNDGIFDEFGLTTVVTHDYASSGLKTIRVRATSPYLYFRLGDDHKKLISIDQWGTIPWGNLYRAFYEAENLIIHATDTPNLSACKNLSFMFYGAKLVGDVTETSNWNWDTSTINNFSSLFNGATSFNQNIGNWDTSAVEYLFQDFPNIGFYQMFKNATSFNQDIGSWDTSNVYVMASMFENAVSFNQNLDQWDIHRVGYLNDMFRNTSLSTQNYDALLNAWSSQNIRPNVEFGAGKSIYCSTTAAASRDSLINNSNWTIYDQGQCLPMLNIVSKAVIFSDENQLDIISIKTTDPDDDSVSFAIIGGDDQAFFSLDSITGELVFINPPNYENPLDLDNNNSYIVEVTATDDGMPQESSTQIITVYINNIFENLANDDFVTTWKTDNNGRSNDTSIIIKTNSHFEYLYDVDWNNDGIFDDVGITGDSTHDYGIASIQTIRIRGQFPSIRFYQEYDQEKLISIDQWGTISWETMLFAFSGTTNLILNASDTPNLSNCDSLAAMFSDSPLVGSEAETSNWNWNTSKVTNMRNMFNNAFSFNKDIGQWDTSRVEDMQYMFDNAHSFNQDIGSWDTANVEIMYNLFKDAYSFNQNLSQWNITRNTEFRNIFNNVTLSVENYDALLIGWNEQIISPDQTFNGGNSIFCSGQAIDAHNNLMTTHGWTIYDKGQCKSSLTVVTNDVVFVDENTTPVIQVVATDSDFDNISYIITGGDDQAFFMLDAITGELSFINPQDYENPQDLNQDNTFLVEVTASDDGLPQESVTQSLTIYVKNIYENLPNDDFVTTWKTDNPGGSNDTSITIKTSGNSIYDYLYNVDWNNDGVFDEFGITGDVTHDFGTPGLKTIRISGLFPRLDFEYSDDKEKIMAIEQWGTNPWESMGSAFYETSNLVNNAQDIPNLSLTTDMSRMFYGASKIGNPNEHGNWNWDTSTITSMWGVFSNATHFNKDISQWDTSRVTGMGNMFRHASSFNQNIGTWDTSNVTYMGSMFSDASSFDQNLSQWRIQKLTSVNHMFSHMRLSIENYDALLIGWSNQNLQPNREFGGGKSVYCSQAASDARSNIITNYNWKFYDNGKCLPQLSIVSNNVIFANENQTAVTQVVTTDPDFDMVVYSISGGDDFSLFTINSSTGALSFITPPDYENPNDFDSNNSYVVEVTATDNGSPQETSTQTITVYINNLFEGLPNDDFVITWKTDKPGSSNNNSIKLQVSGNYPFSYNVDWNNDGIFDEFAISQNITHDFGTPGIKTIRISGLFPAMPIIDSQKLISIDQWGTNEWQTLHQAFYNANNLVNNATDAPNLSSLDINSLSLYRMFDGASSIGSASENSNWNWDTSNVYYMGRMFNNASSFNQDISSWDTSKVNDFGLMFKNATAFNQDIGRWNMSNAYTIENMFAGATNFNQDIGYWNTSRISRMMSVFENAQSFNQDIGNWDTSNVQFMNSAFKYAFSFNQDLSNWNISKVIELDEMFNGATLSVANYDALLIGWAAQNIFPDLNFDAGNSIYCSSSAQIAHDDLKTDNNWTIRDSGQCKPELSIITASHIFVEENQNRAGNIVTTDPDFDSVTYSISGGDDSDKISIDSSTGELTFITAPDFESPSDADGDNIYNIEITVVDNGIMPENATQAFTIHVINVYENLPSDDFVTTWNTELPGSHSNKSIRITTALEVGVLYSFDVDWDNDGVFDEFNLTGEVRHDYSVPGIKTIRISGLFPQFTLYNNSDHERLISIDQWGSNPWQSMYSAFGNGANVVNKAQDTPNLSQCKSLTGMFSDAKSIGATNETANWNWDIRTIETMQNMFYGTYLFNQDISQWNTSRATNVSGMFSGAINFNQDLSQWDIRNVTNFQDMFNHVKLSSTNYDSLLVGWNNQSINLDQEFNAGYSTYCSVAAQNARDNMVNNRNWIIYDAGVCTQALSIVSEDIIEVKENSLSVRKVLTSAPNSEIILFSITGGDDNNLFRIDATTGLLAFINPPDFETPLSTNSNNSYFVEVTATKTTAPQENATQLIQVNVINAQEFVPININIDITSSNTTLNNGDSVQLIVQLTNTGANNANNIGVLDFIHPGLTITSRSCQTTGDATCLLSGENELLSITSNSGSILYTVIAQVIDESYSEYEYTALVELTEPYLDTNINDNSSSITLFDGYVFSNGFEN